MTRATVHHTEQPPGPAARDRAPLRIVEPTEVGVPATATGFAESVRAAGALARRGGLMVPVYRSPPRRPGVDRTIRRLPAATPVVSVRLAGRPAAAVQSDVIEGVVVDLRGCSPVRDVHAAGESSERHAGLFVEAGVLAQGLARVSAMKRGLIVATGDIIDHDGAF